MDSISEPRLDELQKQASGLDARGMEQAATVQRLRRELEQARENDLNAEASAVAAGKKPPKPKAPEVERALDAAEHDHAVYQRAVAMARAEIGQFYAQHHTALMERLAEAKSERAREVADLARPLLTALRGYYAVDDDAKILRPYAASPEETGAPGTGAGARNTLILGGAPMNTQNIFGDDRIAGLARGEVEQVLAALANLPASHPQPREGAA